MIFSQKDLNFNLMISVLYHLKNCQTNRQIVLIFYFTYLITTSLKKINVFTEVSLCYLSRLIIYSRTIIVQYGRILHDFVFHRKHEFHETRQIRVFNATRKTTGLVVLWSYGRWIYNHLCKCLSPLKLWAYISLMA